MGSNKKFYNPPTKLSPKHSLTVNLLISYQIFTRFPTGHGGKKKKLFLLSLLALLIYKIEILPHMLSRSQAISRFLVAQVFSFFGAT
jgi:hypothetical protein